MSSDNSTMESKLDGDTLYEICYAVYQDCGSEAVYDLANSLVNHGWEIDWSECIQCEADTPHLPDQKYCLVCGDSYKTKEVIKQSQQLKSWGVKNPK